MTIATLPSHEDDRGRARAFMEDRGIWPLDHRSRSATLTRGVKLRGEAGFFNDITSSGVSDLT